MEYIVTEPTPRPVAAKVRPNGIPRVIRDLDRWVCWSFNWIKDRWTKTPHRPGESFPCAVTKPENWAPFHECMAMQDSCDGLGIVLGPLNDGTPRILVGTDMDGIMLCDGPHPDAVAAMAALGGYAEWSPRQEGCHGLQLVTEHKPTQRCRRKDVCGAKEIEVYERDRFFCCTGIVFEGMSIMPADSTGAFLEFCEEYLGGDEASDPVPLISIEATAKSFDGITDDEVLEKLYAEAGGQWERVAGGDLSFHGNDHSSADLAFLGKLAWYTSMDRDQMARIWHSTPLGQRKKSGRPDYIERTITKACAGMGPEDGYNPNPGSASAGKPATSGSDRRRSGVEVKYRRSELGVSERFVDQYGGDARYCAERGSWYAWNGQRWALDVGDTQVMLWMKAVVRGMWADVAAFDGDADERKALARFVIGCETANKISAALRLARSELVVRMVDFDSDPMLFNVANGTIELRSGGLRAHARGDLITKMSPVAADPEARCPRWIKFLESIYAGPHRDDLVCCIHRFLGYSMNGLTTEQKLPILWGDGSNGKSTLTDIVSEIMGDYAMEAPTGLITGRGDQHPTVEAGLIGARFVVASETEQGARFRLDVIKRHTGNSTISARFMGADFFEYHRAHTLWIHTNHKPVVRDGTFAVWRRLMLIPHEVKFEGAAMDRSLPDRLRGEFAGILNWLVRGCMDWCLSGLFIPAVVAAATEEYKEQSDPLAEWLSERVCFEEGNFTKGSDAWASYLDWTTENRLGPREVLSRDLFGKLVPEPFVKGKKWVRLDGCQVRGYVGMRLVGENSVL